MTSTLTSLLPSAAPESFDESEEPQLKVLSSYEHGRLSAMIPWVELGGMVLVLCAVMVRESC